MISAWQALIITVLLGSVVAPFFIFRGANTSSLSTWLTRFFVATLVGYAAVIVIAGTLGPEEGLAVGGAFILLATFTAYSYLAILALVARRLGKSPVVWWGVTFITSPVGFLVSYPMMRSRIRAASIGGDG